MPRFKDQEPEVNSGGGGGGLSFIPYIRLGENKESCVFRILTERGDFWHAEFHRTFDGKQFKSYDLCGSELNQKCKLCSSRDDRVSRTATQFFGWVNERYHDYVDEDSIPQWVQDNEDIEEIQRGKRTVFRVQVDAPKLLRYSYAHFSPLQEQFDEEETLLDRDFRWTRTGEAGSLKTTYSLRGGTVEKMSKDLRELASTLPDLEDVALERVTSLDLDDEEEEEEKPKARKKSKKAKKATPEPDEEEDEDDIPDPFESRDESDDDEEDDEDDDI